MAIRVYQPSVSQATMQKAERIAEMIPTLSTGRDKATGIRYVIVPSSDDPEHVGHTATAIWCSCLGFKRNDICSHQLAVALRDQRIESARIAAAQQRRRENGTCKQAGCVMTAETRLGRCEAHTRILLSLVADL